MYLRLLIISVLVGTPYGILNGKEASIRDFPYLVRINWFEAPASMTNCGGSIISKNWLITDIWCVPDNSTRNLTVILAGKDSSSKKESRHMIDKVIEHEGYNHTHDGFIPINSIVLVRVEEPFEFDDTRQPIPLFNTSDKLKPGTIANVIGFSYGAKKLTFYEVPIMDAAECNEKLKYYRGGVLLPEGNLCASSADMISGNVNPDYRKYGDPMVVNGRLAGVASYKTYVGLVLYTDIAYYREWIDKHLLLDSVE